MEADVTDETLAEVNVSARRFFMPALQLGVVECSCHEWNEFPYPKLCGKTSDEE